ncbi:MAG: hypothetical protein REI78_03985 [Pedobacter sp.]|nr:hypothetical protein [Pedobacter sp.]
MEDLWKAMRSDEENKRDEQFKLKLKAIEEKYEYWFSQREDKLSQEKPDRLHNYWVSYNDGNSFHFKLEDELPLMIRQECLEAFNDVYNKD